MPVETDEERLAMLLDFGDDLVVTPKGGAAQPAIKGLFDAEFTSITGLDLEREISDVNPVVICRTIDVPGVDQEDGVEILTGEGVGFYTVSDNQPAWADGAFRRLILDVGSLVP